MRILQANQHKRMPWKNGKGETVEIAVFPDNSTVDTFDWRISVATVVVDGPFSLFQGISRTLSVLTGDGITLSIGGADAVDLKPGSAPFSFPADVPTVAQLHGGPITDLNVMTRRGRFNHRVEPLIVPVTLHPVECQRFVICCIGRFEMSGNDPQAVLDPFDCAVLDPSELVDVSGKGSGFLVAIQPADRRDLTDV